MKTLVPLIVALACTGAQAQTIYRCGPDGRTYSQAPCAQGRRLDLADERSTAQRQEAQTVADNTRALADTLERDRLDRESEIQPAGAGKIGSRPRPAWTESPRSKSAHASKKKHKARRATRDDDFKAVAPTRPRS